MQITARTIAFALLLLVSLGGCETTTPSMLPPELHDDESFLNGFDEPPLWPADAAKGYQRRIRMIIAPMVRERVAIRIDTKLSGRSEVYLVRQGFNANDGEWEILETRGFPIKREQLAALDALIARSKLWQIYPEHWVMKDGNDICIDGVEVILERATPQGYRYSEANAQCTAPRAFLAVSAAIVDIAGLGNTRVAAWLH